MSFSLDARIPVIFGTPEQAGPDDAVLVEGGAEPGPGAQASFQPAVETGHGAGCTCCLPRNQAGRALAALLQDRARGRVPFFNRVLACPTSDAGRAELEAALDRDPVAAACFRRASPARPGHPGRAGAA